ncbi:hypothetical protein [Fusobacterium sp. PH5-44]|uniref:hypothetical protein n=1 Tax=unclassified Fusobacterium TaxID=2648384 RepID=UPI003D1A1644
MRKIVLIIGMMLYTLSFAEKNGDVIEDRIENILKHRHRLLNDGMSKLKVKDYDIDIYQNYVNVEVEIGNRSKNFNFDRAFSVIKDEINKEMNSKTNINIIVELDKVIGDDEIIYNKKF